MYKERRKFIKVIGITTGIILAPSLISTDYNIVNNSWLGHNSSEQDIRIKVLSYAILAPNPHNTQAWLVDLKDNNSIDLYVDKNRILPQTDPFYRQIHIGQGAFLENLSISASYFGYKTDINYFPDGEYDNKTLENKAVASIKLIKDSFIKKDKLFDFILLRHTNKREYKKNKISNEKIKLLKEEVLKTLDCESSFSITENNNEVESLRQLVIEAMRIENLDKKRDLETINMFRFNDEESRKYRDGFGFAQNGKEGIIKFILETFLISRKDAEKNPHLFANEGLKIIEEQANSTRVFAWLTTTENTRTEQVKIGRVYARVHLIVTSLGLVMHPMSQALQEYSDMNKVQKKFLDLTKTNKEKTVQMFFRIGEAEETAHTMRRELSHLFI